jgi:DNA-binding NarL/FixJ family response regulator
VRTVLICDDRRGTRARLTRVVSAFAGVQRVEGVEHGHELLARYTAQPVDLVLVGTQRAVPTGVEATRRLVAAHPRANVIVFGAPDDTRTITEALVGGARGYLRWDAARPELLGAMTHALTTTGTLPAPTVVTVPRRPRKDLRDQPSERELQVLRGMSEGKTNSEIARELFLSEDTIKTHARRLFRKLDAKDRAEAVANGFRRGLVV